MRVLESIYDWPQNTECGGLAIGIFDGVHAGHQAVITALLEGAGPLPACVLTFEPHPLVTLGKEPPPFLMSFAQKCDVLAELGVHTLFAMPFTRDFASTDHSVFAQAIWRALRPGCVVVGQNFRYGRGAEGDIETLRSEGAQMGFRAIGVPYVEEHGVTVSSTAIRRLVSEGDMESALRMLRRPFTVRGEVIHGDGRGKGLGFATANISPPHGQALPPMGVYAATATLSGRILPAVLNIGRRPTFGPGRASIEAHLIGFEGNIYGKTLDVGFVQFLRKEMSFSSPALLSAQVQKDRAQALSVLQAKLGLVYITPSL